jgi:prophage antirepressor-like protein
MGEHNLTIVDACALYDMHLDPDAKTIEITLTTIVDGDGNPWWIAKEVCDYLGYAHTPSAVRTHCKYSQIMTVSNQHSQRGGAQFKTIINEPDLYRIISHSQLPAAKDFECWIMEKVIPSIRKTGAYTMPASGKPMSHLETISRGMISAAHVIEQMTKRPFRWCYCDNKNVKQPL